MGLISKLKNLIMTFVMLLLTTNGITQTTILSEDFSSMGTGYVTQTLSTSSNYQIVNDCTYETWEITTSHNEECSSCTGRFAAIEWYSSSCTQDNVFVTKQFSPSETTISISFDYLFDHYSADYFEVYLYNETDGDQVGSDLVYVTVDTDDSYSGSVNLTGNNSTSDNYTLRFHYYGRYDYGASFDNILVTESSSGGGSGGGNTEVTIGTGTSESGLVPSYGLFDYSWSGMIYLQSEIGNEGDIESISFYVDASSPSSYVMSNQKIYMAHTTNTQFPSSSVQEDFNSNYVSSNWTLVYDGVIDWSPGWEEITLSTPFSYNNTDNLLIKVENREGSYSYSYPEFDYTSSNRRSAYNYHDYSYPTGSGTRTNNRPNIKFNISPLVSPLPVNFVSFEGKTIEPLENQIAVLLKWLTSSEKDNYYFTVWRSLDGYNWDIIGIEKGVGNSQSILEYIYLDRNPNTGINYYNLSQTDFNGETEFYGIISVDVDMLSDRHYITKIYNLLGQEVDGNYTGTKILVWDNGDVEKRY